MHRSISTDNSQLMTAQNRLFQQIYEQSPLGIVINSSKNQVIANQAFCNMLGYSFKELQSKSFLDITHHEDRDKHIHHDHLLQQKQISKYQLQKRYIHKNGQIIYANITVSNVFGENGETTTRLATVENITEQKLAEIAVHQKNLEIEKYIDSNNNLENFAYFASHDLKEPLRTVNNFTQLLKRRFGNDLGKEAHEYMDFIEGGIKHMENLILNLLAFSRANTEKFVADNFSIKDLLENVSSNLKVAIEGKDASLSFHNLPAYIFGNKASLSQLFQNLISNALKFGKTDQVNNIKISCSDQDEYWRFSIIDQGIGIEEEYKNKVFALFKKLHSKNTSYGQGTGIGLALCRKIVERHHGEIWLESELGKGTTFHFTLKKQFLPD